MPPLNNIAFIIFIISKTPDKFKYLINTNALIHNTTHPPPCSTLPQPSLTQHLHTTSTITH
ncbi:MAG: hypothetical protein L0922_03505, partial [Candidatus Mariimomonas ferrooxydans]